MQNEHAQLLAKITTFEIDQGDPALTFTARLARENNWTRDYAERVVIEYKRFLFLICTAGHPVTPSEQVDQAWHLHLTYTRSYWDRLCNQTLHRPVHHDPTRGGHEEDQKFRGQYERTRQRYAQAFGQHPPADVWPDVETRFAPTPRRRPASNGRTIGRNLLIGAASLILGLAVTIWTFGNQSKIESPHVTRADGGTVISLLMIGVLAACLLILAIIKYGGGGKGGGGSGGSCGSGCSGDSGCGGGGCGGGGCGGGGCGS